MRRPGRSWPPAWQNWRESKHGREDCNPRGLRRGPGGPGGGVPGAGGAGRGSVRLHHDQGLCQGPSRTLLQHGHCRGQHDRRGRRPGRLREDPLCGFLCHVCRWPCLGAGAQLHRLSPAECQGGGLPRRPVCGRGRRHPPVHRGLRHHAGHPQHDGGLPLRRPRDAAGGARSAGL